MSLLADYQKSSIKAYSHCKRQIGQYRTNKNRSGKKKRKTSKRKKIPKAQMQSVPIFKEKIIKTEKNIGRALCHVDC